MRFTSTLPPSTRHDLTLGDVSVNIATVSSKLTGHDGHGAEPTTKSNDHLTRHDVMAMAQQQYPLIFRDNPDALPIDVRINADHKVENVTDSPVFCLGVLCLFTLPIPHRWWTGEFDVRVRAADEEQGVLVDQTIHFKREDVSWISMYTPLGLLPIPGATDLPRSNYLFDPGPEAYAKQRWLDLASCVEAIIKAVQQVEPPKIQAAGRWAAHRLDSFSVAGQTLWCKRIPKASQAPEAFLPDMILGEIYRERPDGMALPMETVQLARRLEGGDWQATPQYLWKTKTMCRATAVIEKGKPVHAEITEVNEPRIEELAEIQTTDVTRGAEYIRWRTGVLLQAKTRTLPKLLKGNATQQLQELFIKVEQAVLNCSHEADLAKNRAQQAVEKGGDPAKDREWSLIYNEHLAVLNAILAALKEELANRLR